MLFFSARAITKSSETLSIGLMDKASGKTSWFIFPAAKDTLGLKRDGTTSEVLLKLSAFSPEISKQQLSNLQLVLKEDQSTLIQLDKVTVKEINYQSGYQKAVIVIAILAVIFFLLTFAWTKEQVEPLHEKTSLKNDV
jgi:GPH family glycoside/pentoside/hexuronide:cation symporter